MQSSYTTRGNALELDGQVCGFLHQVEGGDAFSDVIKEPPDVGGIVHKHLAGIKYEDLVLGLRADMSSPVFEWIAAMLSRQDQPKNGAVILPDSPQNASRLEFTSALISEITFPRLDAASKDAASLTLRLTPHRTQSSTGAVPQVRTAPTSTVWLASNFALHIDGVDCSGVMTIEALTVGRRARTAAKEPTFLDVPNLVFTIQETKADELIKWYEDFLIKGSNGPEQRKGGLLQFKAPNMADVLFALTFRNLGIFRLAHTNLDAGTANLRRLRAEMYCEELSLQYATAAVDDSSKNPMNLSVTPYAPPVRSLSVAPAEIPFAPPVRSLSVVRPQLASAPASPTGRFSQLTVPQPFTSQLNLPRPPALNFRS